MTFALPGFIPESFLALALAHFLALVSPGPDFFLIIGHAVRRKLRGTIFICAGIALGNAAYIALAIAGWAAVKESPVLYRCLELAGAAYLAWLGFMLLRSSRRPASFALHEAAPAHPAKQFLLGAASALLNPKNAIFYLTIMTAVVGPSATLAQRAFSGAWMVCLVFAWDVALAAAISSPNTQRRLWKNIPVVEGAAGIVLLCLAASIAVASLFVP